MIIIRRPLSPYHCHMKSNGPCRYNPNTASTTSTTNNNDSTDFTPEDLLLRHLKAMMMEDMDDGVKCRKRCSRRGPCSRRKTQHSPSQQPTAKTSSSTSGTDNSSNPINTHILKTPVHRDETETSATISFDVSGFSVDQLEISVDNNVLSILGQRQNRLGDWYKIHRRFALKESVYDAEGIEANLSEGVLELRLPKRVRCESRSIPIVDGSAETAKADVVNDAKEKPNEAEDIHDEKDEDEVKGPEETETLEEEVAPLDGMNERSTDVATKSQEAREETDDDSVEESTAVEQETVAEDEEEGVDEKEAVPDHEEVSARQNEEVSFESGEAYLEVERSDNEEEEDDEEVVAETVDELNDDVDESQSLDEEDIGEDSWEDVSHV